MESRVRAWPGRIIVPLLLLAAGWVLWQVSDRAVRIGPLDRAAFGWAVVVPMLVGAVPAAAFAWRPLPRRGQWIAAIVLGACVAAVVATLLARAYLDTHCEFGNLVQAPDAIVRAAAVGIGAGGAFAAAGLLAARLGGGTRMRLVSGAALGIGACLVGLAAFVVIMPFATCARPPV